MQLRKTFANKKVTFSTPSRIFRGATSANTDGHRILNFLQGPLNDSHISIYVSTYLSIYLPISLSCYLSISLSFYLSISLSFYLSIYRSIYPSISYLRLKVAIFKPRKLTLHTTFVVKSCDFRALAAKVDFTYYFRT